MTEPRKPAEAEPRKAAAAIILSAEPEPRVLMVRRSDRLRFMAGHHAFPGGRIDDSEGSARVAGAPDDDEAAAIHALAREVFEETGILLARPVGGAARALAAPAELREARVALLAGAQTFDSILERFGAEIDAAKFIPAGLWITPKGGPIRFHTRYYLIQLEGPAEAELIEGEIARIDWYGPAEARRLWREGKILLPPPVAYALQQLENYPLPDAIEPLRRTTHIVPDTPGRIEWRCGINVLPLRSPTIPPATRTNCIAIGDRELIVIDPPTPYSSEREILRGQIDHLLERGGSVAAVVLSHSHPDHVAAAEFMRQTYGAPIWAHAAAASQVKFAVDRLLGDEEIIEVPGDPAWRIRCLHTPGHDPGHLAFHEETTRTLLCGDLIANGSSIVVSLQYGGDMDHYLKSLERLLELDFDLMIPAHGLVFEDPKAKVREYIAHRLEREARIVAALERGRATMRELLADAYSDVPEKTWPLAEHSLRAHLKRLGVSPPR